MELTLQKVTPFLPTLTAAQTTRVSAWLPVLEVLINQRFGDRITAELEPVFSSTAADAIGRRLAKTAALIDMQAVGTASVRYNARASLAVWFLPEELDTLNGLFESPGARTYRTPAPDGIRFNNLARDPLDEEC